MVHQDKGKRKEPRIFPTCERSSFEKTKKKETVLEIQVETEQKRERDKAARARDPVRKQVGGTRIFSTLHSSINTRDKVMFNYYCTRQVRR